MDYDYNVYKRKNDGAGGTFRLLVIFVVVAAVIGGIIWKTIPAKKAVPGAEKSVPEKTAGDVKETESANRETKSARSDIPVAEKTPAVPEKKAAVPERGLSGKKDVPAVVYEKGRASGGDIPAEMDKPGIPEESALSAEVQAKELQKLEELFRQKKYAAVSAGAGAILEKLTVGSAFYRKILDLLSRSNWERFLQRDTKDGFAIRHTVSAGEYLGRIVRKHKTTVSAVMQANRLKDSRIRVGQKLVILTGTWKVRVLKEMRLLLVLRNERVFMGFDVGVGRFGKTPTADFVISDRLKNPVYRTPDGRVFAPGEAGNELGGYFLKLVPTGNPGRALFGYGIHGTPDESSVTRSLSNGCIRMRNQDVMQLYCLLPSGTPVSISE